MPTIEQAIWECIHTSLTEPIYVPNLRKKTREDFDNVVDFKATLFRGLIATRNPLAHHYNLDPLRLVPAYTDVANELSEYILDFSWTTYPPNRWFSHKHPFPKPDIPFRLLLAIESEASYYNRGIEEHYTAVMEDFVKLIDVKCPIKVLIYRPPLEKKGKSLASMAEAIKSGVLGILANHGNIDKSDRWLMIGVPWCKGPFQIDKMQTHLVKYEGDVPNLHIPDWLKEAQTPKKK